MGLLLSLAFICLIAINVPIAFSMGLASVFGLLLKGDIPLVIIPQKIFTGSDSFPLLAIPFFVLAGALMDTGGISIRLVNLARSLVGHFRNGLGMVSIVAEIFFSGISGSTAADTAAIGSLMIPAMKESGYTPPQATAIVCAACGMGILVPPCIAMVVYGGIANVSVGALFAGGFLPALAMAMALMIQLNIQARRGGKPPGKWGGIKPLAAALKESILALFMPVIIFGGILGGICTPTEAAVLAAAYGLVISMAIYREINLAKLAAILVETGMVTGKVMIMVGMASAFAWILSREQVPQALAQFIFSIGGGKVFFLFMINVAFLFIGAVLEGVPALIMTVPILLPIATQLGVDPVHFGIVLIANMGIGLFLPPVGLGVFIGCSIAKITVAEVVRPLLPYLAMNFAVVLIITYWPWLTLVLPNLFFLHP
jgi:C4-dicarboxylate transporter DctM subunit